MPSQRVWPGSAGPYFPFGDCIALAMIAACVALAYVIGRGKIDELRFDWREIETPTLWWRRAAVPQDRRLSCVYGTA